MEKIGIIGSGTWGTAIAVLLRNNGHEVTLWSAIPAEIEEMAKTRTHKNLPGVTLPEGIIYTADLEEAMKDKNLLVMAVPSVFVRSTAQKMKPFCKEGQLIVDVAKGIEENTLDTMTQIIKEELPMAETAFRTEPRGGGKPRTSDALRCGIPQEERCRVRPVHIYQPGVPRIHEPGCPGDRDRRRVKERCCPGSGNR
mgnify:CR=1 FL=1